MQNWFASKANPIGIDFGSDCLRLAQVQRVSGEYQLIAAASADVPSHVRHNAAARLAFFVQTTRDLLAQGKFRGRQAVLALPASLMFIQHLRLPRMDEEAMQKALPWEVRGKLPIDPSRAIIRHLIAGEIYQDQELKNEVIVMAASHEMVDQFLNAATKARLDVVGMDIEPKAMVGCFGGVYRRKTDSEATTCYVDIGCSATRAIIARQQQILFARTIPVGGDHFTRAVAAEMKLSFDDAKAMRIQLAKSPAPATESVVEEQPLQHAFPLLEAGLKAERRGAGIQGAVALMTEPDATTPEMQATILQPSQRVEQACREPLNRMVEELDLCRRYYETTFPNTPVNRMIFVGGEAHQRTLCQHIAREMGLAAQVGDPLVRMGKTSEIEPDCGIDLRQPQPAWAVAIGLSMGSPATEMPEVHS